MEANEKATDESENRKIEFACDRDRLQYRAKPPRFFQFFNASSTVLCPESTREEFWFILTKEEKRELIHENYVDLVDNIVSRVRTKITTEWYQKCIRLIKDGLEAIQNNKRCADQSKQQVVNEFFETKKRKRFQHEVSILQNIELPDLPESF